MDDLRILPVTNEELILNVATMAEEIWHEYFPALISEEQIDYMLEKFLSFDSIFEQIQNGYEYFLLIHDYTFAGFAGVHEENGSLFLSKLYIHKDFRGNGISSKVMKNLIELCKVRSLDKIWLTCNRGNESALAIYKHFGFIQTREQVSDIGGGFVMDDYILEYPVKQQDSLTEKLPATMERFPCCRQLFNISRTVLPFAGKTVLSCIHYYFIGTTAPS